MTTLPFTRIDHFEQLEFMYFLHHLDAPTMEEIPLIGYISFIDEMPIAAAFLRRVEGGYGQIDGLVSNPECPGHLRHQALDIVIKKCIQDAKVLKLKNLMAFSIDVAAMARAKRLNFVELPHCLLAIDLNSGKA
jgi:hypothetical protein